jgi:hypothetical protein
MEAVMRRARGGAVSRSSPCPFCRWLKPGRVIDGIECIPIDAPFGMKMKIDLLELIVNGNCSMFALVRPWMPEW